MSDRVAFRALMIVAGLLIFCLGCILVGPLRLVWWGTSLWLVCCSLLTHHMMLPMASSASPILPVIAWLLLSLAIGSCGWTAWRVWGATRRLTCLTHTAWLPHPPVVARLAAQLNLKDPLIVVSGRTPFSFCYGLWRPRICLSVGLIEVLTETELAAVLCHEAYHLRRREPLRMAVAICLSRLLFFAPLISELRDCYLAEKELAADAFAVAATSRTALAGAMYKLITTKSQLVSPPLAAVAGLSVTAQRVDRLIYPAIRPSWAISPKSIVITVAVFVISCVSMLIGLI